jgi:hypothetical protein
MVRLKVGGDRALMRMALETFQYHNGSIKSYPLRCKKEPLLAVKSAHFRVGAALDTRRVVM